MTREAEVEGLMASSVGLPEMAKLLAVPMDEIAVVDASDNDIAMFGRTGLSISIGNASREVRMS
jgi:hydroxymethylpyrimidine pyrophosphatase-like HAD family hydrolase